MPHLSRHLTRLFPPSFFHHHHFHTPYCSHQPRILKWVTKQNTRALDTTPTPTKPAGHQNPSQGLRKKRKYPSLHPCAPALGVLKSEPRGLRAGTTLPSGPRALRRKDVCALRYSVPSLELLAASPGPSCSCSTAFPNVATGGKITFQSALQGVHFHLDPLEVHLLPRSRESPLA